MNIYFLVEGKSTEKKIYPKWLEYLIPELTPVKYSHQVVKNNDYLISGKGYPALLCDPFDNAIDKIQETDNYDYLVICLDVDEDTVDERKEYVNNIISSKDIDLGKTKIEIILQNRCIETWLLGNNKIFDSRQPQTLSLSDYVNYYDVSKFDPELMGDFNLRNHGDFHYQYLKEIFKARNSDYTKKKPRDALKKHYFERLQKRIEDNSTHLQTFQYFINFCSMIKSKINQED